MQLRREDWGHSLAHSFLHPLTSICLYALCFRAHLCRGATVRRLQWPREKKVDGVWWTSCEADGDS